MDLQEKVALVTGAGSGIGKACALRLAADGARVIVHAHKEDETHATVEAIEQAGGEAFGITADLRDDKGFKGAIERVESLASRSAISRERAARLTSDPLSFNCLWRRAARSAALAVRKILRSAEGKTTLPISRPSAISPGGAAKAR